MGFTFNGITSKSKRISSRLLSWSLSPQIRNSFVSVPGKSGVMDFGSDIAERIINVSCNIYPKFSFGALVAAIDDLAEWLNPEIGLRQLVFDEAPDRYFNARLNAAVDCERLAQSSGSFTLQFVCPDPYGYALTDESFTASGAGITSITRTKGNANSAPVYSLKAALPHGAANSIIIKTNGVSLNIGGLLNAGETLIIDSGLFTAKITDAAGNTLRNGLPLLQNLNFPSLKKGANSLEITLNGAAALTELDIRAMSRWR
jgi:predicted phage tail component-like protein